MKKTLLVAALATLTTSAFAGSAMDLNIPDSPTTASPARSAPMVSARPVTAVSRPVSVAMNTAVASDSGVTMPSTAPVAAGSNTSRNTASVKGVARPARVEPTNAASAPQAASAAPAETANNGIPTLDSTTGNAVNPFTGKSLNEEDLQRQLEASKARTSLLEEQLKQVTITADIANVPLKKRAEVAKLELPAPPVAASAPPAQPKPVKKHPVKKTTPAVEVVAPKMPNVRLDGVVVNQGVASAILDVDGNSSVVANGGSTPFGPVRVLNATSAMVGGMALHVSDDSTIARVHISDPKPVDPKERATLPVLSVPGATGASANGARPLPPVPLPPPTTATTTVH